MKLDLELYRYGNLVFGRVIQQSSDLINPDKSACSKILYEDSDFKISSETCPALYESSLCVRGLAKELDSKVFSHMYDEEDEAIAICKKIKEGVNKINGEPQLNSSIEKIM